MVDQLEVISSVGKVVKKCVLAWNIMTEVILRGYTPTTNMLHRMTKVCVQGTLVVQTVRYNANWSRLTSNHPFSGLKSDSHRPCSRKLVEPTWSSNRLRPWEYREYHSINNSLHPS